MKKLKNSELNRKSISNSLEENSTKFEFDFGQFNFNSKSVCPLSHW